MPAIDVIFHRLAAGEYRAAPNWYAKRSDVVAGQFRASVDHAIDRNLSRGNSLPTLVGDYRYVRVGRFPYLLIFRSIDPNSLMIFAVAHTSRRPGYWRRRK